MFDDLVAATAGTSGARALDGWTRVESASCARRLSAMVDMLDHVHAADGSADRDQWCLDNWSAVTAHIGVAAGITSGTASNMLLVGIALRERFPKVSALFSAGLISYQVVRVTVTRSANVIDPDALRSLDERLSQAFQDWEPLSVDKTEKTIDAIIAEVDPLARRRREAQARDRGVQFATEDGSGIATLFATLFATDAKALETRLNGLANTACPGDPRTKDQRCADAMGALAHGADRLSCLCGAEACLAAVTPPSTGVVVYVVAHQDTLDARPDREATSPPPPDEPVAPGDPELADAEDAAAEFSALDGSLPTAFSKPLREQTLIEAWTALTNLAPAASSTIRPATMMSGAFLPGAIAQRAALGAMITTITHPGQTPPENRYTPSKRLADFVRARDLTCRFPGCCAPATNCDLDHTIPWPYGPTQASNLKALCRKHHLLKTFWSGDGGWQDRQFPDGTVEWTAPNGRRHLTRPGSRPLFPELCTPTAPTVSTGRVPLSHNPGLRMPRRQTTRAQDRARRIVEERELNRADAEADGEAAPPF
ncbi:HNH endonuclease signature motif containing protein [Mycolicibacterium hodleri]|uniref:HNH endonuclease n=1 Tax=Mycolicibacterium hodleri TaxID=49897 RepID=A0A502EDZ3_9MYCO|nr:HNH endonuclease signature motif containing protein [Mycolicibacterium hodleri]TPG35229.1 HNH endonuclease [Mycolicibacterium hodleri]